MISVNNREFTEQLLEGDILFYDFGVGKLKVNGFETLEQSLKWFNEKTGESTIFQKIDPVKSLIFLLY